jgi:hypothetical protein
MKCQDYVDTLGLVLGMSYKSCLIFCLFLMKTLSFFQNSIKILKSTNRKVAKVIFCSDQPKEGRLQDVEASTSRFSGLDGKLHQGHLHLRGPVRQQARLAQGA